MIAHTTAPRILVLIAAGLVLSSSSLKADFVYYLPFESGAGASLANSGTAGGTATAVTGISGATAPSGTSLQSVSSLDSSWSEYFPVTGTDSASRGGAVVLPNSAAQFRLDSGTSANQMTISTWVYWNGVANGSISGIAGNAQNGGSTGWDVTITTTGALGFSWHNPAGTARGETTAGSVMLSAQWVNVAVVFNSNNAQPVSIYLNGVAYAVTGSAGDPTMGTIKSDSNPIAVGIGVQTNGAGRYALNGYLDDYAMWDTALVGGQIRAINTAPALLTGYNADVMNTLFSAYATEGSSVVGSLNWAYATGLDVSGHALGDTWLGADDKYYMWLAGASDGLVGSVSGVPEPATCGLLVGAVSLFMMIGTRRRWGCRPQS